ncbi:MAG TPA: TetR family transcriptional regulator [Candidatus Dormibacteraeota bacterium]|nr:TetR family transcriptional regulator [Candidatus Dormibacteraeota bacterium]
MDTPLSPEEERPGLTRERLVEAALELINEEGLDGLSMRALADKLDVKASSLYWHVRDRRELLDLLGESILESVGKPRRGGGWRENVLAAGAALGRRVAKQKDADRILLEVPDALRRSDLFYEVVAQLRSAGLQPSEASDVALMLLTHVITGQAPDEPPVVQSSSNPASIAIDSGSRGVELRAGTADMQGLIRVPRDQSAAAPAVVRGETVVVRRLRGVGRGQIELNPRRPWTFKVQAPTWNTVIDASGLDLRELHVDSGAVNLEVFLPRPRGVVPLHISSGVMNVALHRARGAAVVAHVHTGAVKLKLDDYSTKVAVFDVYWQSEGEAVVPNRYELDVSSGVVDFKLDSYMPKVERVEAAPVEPQPAGKAMSALELLLDGVEARIRTRS